jgi:flagellar biosynthetic protein FliS
MKQFAINRYVTTSQQTCSQEEVLLRLLDGAVANVALARDAVLERAVARKAKHVDCVLQIVGELLAALDDQHDPAVAAQLRTLYAFVNRRLLIGSANFDARSFAEAEKVLASIAATFREAVKIQHAEERSHG